MKKCNLRTRMFALVLSLTMLFAILPMTVFAENGDDFHVTISMEGLTLGQGLYVEPTTYTLNEINALVANAYGEYTEDTLTAAVVTAAMLIDKGIEWNQTGDISSFYLSQVKDIDKGTVNIPEIITENGGPDNESHDGNDDEYLGEFDYSMMAGWMITVNHLMIPVGAGQYNVEDGAVIRWHFSVWGYGADLGFDNGWGMGGPYFTAANKDSFYREYAKAAASGLFASNTSVKTDALAVMEKLTATQAEVDSATKALESAARVAATKKKIDAISETVTTADTATIDTARKAYEALSDEEKAKINAEALNLAEKKLETAKKTRIDDCLKDTEDYLVSLTKNNDAVVGSIGGEWWVLSLARAGMVPNDGFYCRYLEAVKQYVSEKINDSEQLHRSKSTDNSRVILALVSIGIDPTNIAGHNLLQGLTSMKYVKKQGINGPVWALIALDSHHFTIPAAADAADQVTREALIGYVLSKQLADGGWALSGTAADPDMTAMAMQALAPYYHSDNTVKAAVDKAVSCLSLLQKDNGGFASWGTVNSESCAQAIVALTALGIHPASDSRFIKNGYSVVDALCNFAVEDGGFRHTMNGTLNGMATEQAAYALVAFARFKDGKTSLYNMSDIAALKSDMHTWDNGVVKEAATCKMTGKKRYTCTGCGATKEEVIPVTDNHIWNNGEIIKGATVNEEGVQKYTCTVCGKNKEEAIAKLTLQQEKPSDNQPKIESNITSPATGDTTDFTLPIFLIVISSGVITVLMLDRKKHLIISKREANRL